MSCLLHILYKTLSIILISLLLLNEANEVFMVFRNLTPRSDTAAVTQLPGRWRLCAFPYVSVRLVRPNIDT